jgi:hypothetical protein
MVRPLAPHVRVGDAMKLCINEGQEFLSRCLITCMHSLKKPRGLASIIHEMSRGPVYFEAT